MHVVRPDSTAGSVVVRAGVSAVTDELDAWRNRLLDAVRPIVRIDALWVKVRSGLVASRPVHPVHPVPVTADLDEECGDRGEPRDVEHVGGQWGKVDGGRLFATGPSTGGWRM
ncbi:transposase [Streptomyces roseoverticillatus]|uniref:transposase n=1 Tax=Streptomyces roseoverticillatus TaxID=66429 RepID=UPI003F56BFC3